MDNAIAIYDRTHPLRRELGIGAGAVRVFSPLRAHTTRPDSIGSMLARQLPGQGSRTIFALERAEPKPRPPRTQNLIVAHTSIDSRDAAMDAGVRRVRTCTLPLLKRSHCALVDRSSARKEHVPAWDENLINTIEATVSFAPE